ncbi:MAG: hypothetical protein ACRDWW_06500, partial [Acidimicrobiales bacterium]
PIATGDWGRPPGRGPQCSRAAIPAPAPEVLVCPTGVRAEPARFRPAPPPPPPPAAAPLRGLRRRRPLPYPVRLRRLGRLPQPWGLLRQRPVTAGIEAGVALAILLAVAFAGAGGGPSHEPSPSASMAAWGDAAVPVVTNLVDDLRAVAADMVAPVPGPTLRADTATLRRDLAGARRLPGPPDARAGRAWADSLAEVGAAVQDLTNGGPHPGSREAAAAQRELGEAADSLLEVGSLVEGVRHS